MNPLAIFLVLANVLAFTLAGCEAARVIWVEGRCGDLHTHC